MLHFIRNFSISFCLFTGCLKAAAQQHFFERSVIGVQGHYGSFLTNAPKAQYVRDSYTYFAEAYWQQPLAHTLHKGAMPMWGVGVFGGHTGSHQYMGSMAGAFTFLNLPLYKLSNWESRLRLSGGIAWVEKPYNENSNHKNVLIGSPFNGFINIQWQNSVQVSAATALTAGISFSHLSNGGITLPNLGLNVPALSLGLQYGLAAGDKNAASQVTRPTPKRVLKNFTSAGIKQLPWIHSRRYLLNVLQVEGSRAAGANSHIGGGAMVVHNPSLEVDPTTIISNKRDISKLQAGVFLLYEYHMGKVSLPLQLGTYVYNRDANPVLFQQLGIRYAFFPHWAGQLLLKAHGGRADLLHAGIGYQW